MPQAKKVVFGENLSPEEEIVNPAIQAHTLRGDVDVDLSAPCYKCNKSTGGSGNDMIFCDGCNRCVHQKCHGLDSIPKGMFFCEVCSSPLVDPKDVATKTFSLFSAVVLANGGWPQNTVVNGGYPPLHNTLFSMEAMTASKWYQDLPKTEKDQKLQLQLIVPHKMFAITQLIYNNSNLMKNHRSTFSVYSIWCGMEGADNPTYALDSAEKAANFLRYYIDFTVKNRKRSNFPEAETAFNACRNAIAPLEHIADIYGFDEFKFQLGKRHKPVKALYDFMMTERNKVRNDVQDNAATSRMNTKTLMPNEKQRMITAMMDGSSVSSIKNHDTVQMRDVLLICLLDVIGRRGEDLRALRLPMFLTHTLTKVGPAPCNGIGASLRMVKERVNAEETMLTWIRTNDRWICPIGALAMYLVWLNDLNNRISIIDTIRTDLKRMDTHDKSKKWISEWWKIHLVFTSDPNKPIAPSTHISGTGRIFSAASIEGKTAKTQIHRSTTAINLIEAGVTIEDVEMYQGWRHTTATDVYVRSAFKAGPLVVAADWESTKEFMCWWETPEDEIKYIPQSLLDKIFPGLDEVADLAKSSYNKYKLDKSAVEFTELLKYLRRVFLEDAVCKREVYPSFPAFRHTVFDQVEWLVYAESEGRRVNERQEAWEAKRTNPELAKVIAADTEKKFAELHAKLDAISKYKDAVAAVTPAAQSASLQEILTWKDTNMVTIYNHWDTHRSFYAQYIDNNRRLPWKQVYGRDAKPHRTRFSKLKPWLLYIDKCVEAGHNATDVVGKFVSIAATHKMLHSSFVKDTFYNMTIKSSSDSIPNLQALITAVGLPDI